MSTNERILDQIVEEVQGVIAKMDEHDLEQAMPLITKKQPRLRGRRRAVRVPGAQLRHAHDAHRLHELHDG